ncbi:MAG: ABC transporter permease, partial [Ignavibacteria bacterium]
MIHNYLKIVLRNVINQKIFSLINILGLAFGMTVCMLSIIFIRYELSYDTYHENADNIYRVTRKFNTPNGYNPHFARCPDAWVNSLPDEFPEIKTLIRFQWIPSVNLKIGEEKLRSTKWYVTDADVFDVFSFNMIEGNHSTALKEPRSVVVTKKTASLYFGNKNPIGKEIILISEADGEQIPYKITGVIDNLPVNSHFQIDFLVSYDNPEARQGWAWIYLLLQEGTNSTALEKKFPEFVKKYGGEEAAKYGFLHIQALTNIHLHSHLDREIEPTGDIQYIYIFSVIAFLVILIACFNFMNLSTARSVKRAKEIGIRKVLGAYRKELINYFLCESVFFSLLAFVVSSGITIIIFPFFSSLLGNSISVGDVFYLPVLVGFFLLALLTGFFSGIYPAFVLSSFNPLTAFTKGNNLTRSKKQLNFTVRRVLVVLQFAMTVVLITFTLFCLYQFSFISNKKLGFEKDQVLAVTNVSRIDLLKYPVFKNQLESYSGIGGITACMDVPSRDILDQGFSVVEGVHSGDESTILALQSVDENFLDVMKIKLLAGKNFTGGSNNGEYEKTMDLTEMQTYTSEKEYTYIINESAVRKLGWTSPEEALGKKLQWTNAAFSLSGRITGVVEDFNYASLHLQVRPLVLINEPIWFGNILVKISGEDVNSTINQISDVWDGIYEDSPMQYEFLDDMFAAL